MKKYKYFPDVWGAVFLLACFLMLEILIANAFYDAGILFDVGDPRSTIISVIASGVVFSVFMHFSGIKYNDLFHPSSAPLKSTLIRSVFPVTLVVVSSFWWLGELEYYIASLFPEDKSSLIMLDLLMNDGIVTMIAICIIAPFLEEMLFRGVILRGFLSYYSPRTAIILSSVLFGAIHLNIYQIPGAFVFGCFVGWLFYISRSLWPCIFAHSLTNTGSYVFYILSTETYLEEASNTSTDSNALIFIPAILFSLLGLYFLFIIFMKRE